MDVTTPPTVTYHQVHVITRPFVLVCLDENAHRLVLKCVEQLTTVVRVDQTKPQVCVPSAKYWCIQGCFSAGVRTLCVCQILDHGELFVEVSNCISVKAFSRITCITNSAPMVHARQLP